MNSANWRTARLSSIATISMGQSPTSTTVNQSGSGMPFIQGNAEFGLRSPRPAKYCTQPRKRAHTGDILVSVRAPVGAINLADQSLCIGRGLAAVTPTDVFPEFLWHALRRGVAQLTRVAQGSTFAAVNKADLSTLEILLPSAEEQRRIAAILSSLDDVIEKTQAVIDQVDVTRRGLMCELFTRGPRRQHKRFRESAVGPLPHGWKVVRLGDLAAVKGGKRMPKGRPFASTKTPYPYLRVVDFKDGSIDTSGLKYVLPQDREQIKRYTISQDDVYISIAGTLGLVGSIPPELDGAQLTENAAKIVLNERAHTDKDFVRVALGSKNCQTQLVRLKGVGGGVPKLALFRLEQVLLPLPTRQEQREIVGVFDGIRKYESKLKGKLAAIGKLKSALMSVLLTGELRVTPDPEPA